MKRWDELMVAYALGTLTHQERRDLSQMAAQDPQLMLDASRLRHMTSLQIAQKLDWPTEGFEVGAEGWADTATRSLQSALPDPIAADLRATTSALPDPGCSTEALDRGSLWTSFWLPFWPPSWLSAAFADWKMPLSRGLWRWLMVVGLVCLGIDDWRVRRLLSMMQVEVLQMEMRTDGATWKD